VIGGGEWGGKGGRLVLTHIPRKFRVARAPLPPAPAMSERRASSRGSAPEKGVSVAAPSNNKGGGKLRKPSANVVEDLTDDEDTAPAPVPVRQSRKGAAAASSSASAEAAARAGAGADDEDDTSKRASSRGRKAASSSSSSSSSAAAEPESWPPRLTSALRPVVLPFGIDAPGREAAAAAAAAAAASGARDEDETEDDDDEYDDVGKGGRRGGVRGSKRRSRSEASATSSAAAAPMATEADSGLEAAAAFVHPPALGGGSKGGAVKLREGALLHLTLPAVLPQHILRARTGTDAGGSGAASAGKGAGAGAGAGSAPPPLPPLDDDSSHADPSHPYRARIRAIAEGKIGKVRRTMGSHVGSTSCAKIRV
jgi:hypothetical protein